MPELEFLPEKTKRVELGVPRKLGRGVLFIVIALVIYGGLFFYNQRLESKVRDLDARFMAFNQARDKAKEERVSEVDEKLNQGNVLLDEHVVWSAGFKKIQGLTLPSIQFQSLAASIPELKFEFRAIGPNLASIARQGANFLADDSIKDMSINQIKILTTGQTEFVVKLTFDRDKFLNNEQ